VESTGTSFQVLKQRNFAIFWGAALVSNIGSWMQTTTIPFVIYKMTGSTTWLGFAAFAQVIPMVLVTPFAGSFADRHSRKAILLVTQTGMMVVAFLLWLVWTSGAATPWNILAVVCCAGLIGGVTTPSWQAFVIQLVPERQLMDAVRLNSVQFMAGRALGPAIAAAVLQAFGPGAAFLSNAVSFVVVLVALLLIHPRPQVFSADTSSVGSHVREGFRIVRGDVALFVPIVMIGIVSLFGTSVLQLAPALAKEEFEVGRGAYALLVAAFGFGAITGSLASAFFADRLRRSVAMTAGGIVLPIALIVLGVAPAYALGLAALYVMGTAHMVIAVALNTSLQSRVHDTFRGRVMSMYLMMLVLGSPLGALLGGKLATIIGLRAVMVSFGILLLLCVTYAIARYDRFRVLEAPPIRRPVPVRGDGTGGTLAPARTAE
jgi:MFS family permease